VFSGWWLVAFYVAVLLLWQPRRVDWQKEVVKEFAHA
jgi:hypothetical protein